MTRDELVEALGVLLRDVAYEGFLAFPMDVSARFVDRHRLVSLPEEPNGWVDMEDDILLWGYTGPNDGMTPFYTPNGGIDDADCILLDFGIPGDPQEVDDG